MPESSITPPASTSPAVPNNRGYFNQAQLEDLTLADSVHTASISHPA